MKNRSCEICHGCTCDHKHKHYKCIPCRCDWEEDEVDEDAVDEDEVDLVNDDEDDDYSDDEIGPYPPRSPYERYRPPVAGCWPNTFPSPQFKSQPDLTIELLKALLASHEKHIEMMEQAHQRELEMLLMMQERSCCEKREKKSD